VDNPNSHRNLRWHGSHQLRVSGNLKASGCTTPVPIPSVRERRIGIERPLERAPEGSTLHAMTAINLLAAQ
jgi:hypothetical protein